MNDQTVHVEFTMTGVSRDIFASVLQWIGDGLQPFFPIVSGAWGLFETAAFALTLIGAGLAALMVRRMLGDRSTELDTTNAITGVRELQDASLRASNPSRVSPAAALPGQHSVAAVAAARTTCRAVGFVSRMGLYYVALSLAVCWVLGTGDLGVLAAFSVGGSL